MTFRDHLRDARKRLVAAGVNEEEAALDAELLARDLLGADRAGFVADLGTLAPEGFATAYQAVVARREAREPMAYIRGRQAFWGRDFLVTPAVLIPRPETELVIEEALAAPFRRALDIGTGSGCLAITLALAGREPGTGNREVQGVADRARLPLQEATPPLHPVEATLQGCLIIATDISEAALEVARENADRLLGPTHGNLVKFRHGAYAAGAAGPFDLIVSNPPYVTSGEYATLQPEVRSYEPATALVAGDDGLDDIRQIVRLAPDILAPGGRLVMEIGHTQADSVREVVTATPGLSLQHIRRDLQDIPRVAVVTAA